jgi:hypothetical protein
MSESLRTDSAWGMAMPKAYSADLRKGVIEAVEVRIALKRQPDLRFSSAYRDSSIMRSSS